MYCISCGANLPDNARYCAVCGAEVYNPANDADAVAEEPAAAEVADAATEQPAQDDAPAVESEQASDGETAAVKGEPAASEEAQRGKIRMKVKNPALLQDSGPIVLPEIGTSGPIDLPEIGQSSAVSLPEIDPANPQSIPPREGGENDVSVSADVTVALPRGPFKPSYGPLSPSDLFERDGTTAKMPRIETANGEVLVSGESEAKNFVQSNTIPKRWTPLRVFALVVMVLVAVALAIVAVHLYGQRQQQPTVVTTSASAPAVTSTSSAEPPSTTVTESASTQQSEETRLASLYDGLTAAYAAADTLNESLKDVVDDYNTYYAASDTSSRQAASDRCADLASQIAQAQADATAAMEQNACTEGTAYYDQYQTQLRLLDLLAQRVAPLTASWERSVASESPASDESYILEPLTQVDSTSLAHEFDDLYASSAPVEE